MRIYKLFENVHEDLVEKLQNIIIADKKTINGFKFSYDSMSGVFEWDSKYYIFYATPYWDGGMELPINVSDDDGEDLNVLYQAFNLPILKNDYDVKKCIEFYYEKINEISLSLNRRIELKDNIELIKKVLGNVPRLTNVEVDKISDSIVDTLFRVINSKYSYIILGNKYNL